MIPAYNNELTISRCLTSVLEQDYDNLQIGVLDNFSTDNTYDILVEFEKKYRKRLFIGRNYFKLNEQEHRLRTILLVNSRAIFTLFLRPESVFDKTFVRSCIDVLQSDNKIGFVSAHADCINSDSSKRRLPCLHDGDLIVTGITQMQDTLLNGFPLNAISVFRREIYYFGYQEKYIFARNGDIIHYFMAAAMSNMGYIHETKAYLGDDRAILGENFVPDIEELIERYLVIQAFITIAQRLKLGSVVERAPEAFEKLCKDCLRSSKVLKTSNRHELSRQYCSLALAFNPNLDTTYNDESIPSLLSTLS